MALVRAVEAAILSGCPPRATLGELLGLLADLGARAWVVEALEMAALVCEAEGRTRSGARLLGACRAIEEALDEPAHGRILSGEVDRLRGRLAEALGPDLLTDQEGLGRAMSIEEALSYALDELEELDEPPSVVTPPGG